MTGDQLLAKHYTRYLARKPPPRPMGLDNLDAFFHWFDGVVEEIPQGARRHVVAHPGYEIYYSETPEEAAARETQEPALLEGQKNKYSSPGIGKEELAQFEVAVADWIPVGDPIRTRLLKVLDDMRARLEN